MRRVIYFWLYFISLNAVAQLNGLDSLLRTLNTANEDTIKVNILNKLCWVLRNDSQCVVYFNQSVELSNKLGYQNGLATAYNHIGMYYKNEGHYKKALDYHFLSRDINLKTNNKTGLARSYNNIAVTLLQQGNYPKSMEFHLKSLAIRMELGDKEGQGSSYNNLGAINHHLANYKKSLYYYLKAQNIRKELSNKKDYASTLANIGSVYADLKNHEMALKYYLQSIGIRQEIEDTYGIASVYNNLGTIYSDQGDYAKARDYFDKSIELKNELNDKEGLAVTYNNMAHLLLKQKHYKLALGYNTQSLKLAQDVESVDDICDAEKLQSELYELLGDKSKAFEHYKAYILARDELFNEENTKSIVRTEMNYEFEKKETAAKLREQQQAAINEAEHKRQHVIILSISGILVIVICFALFAYRSYKQKQRANRLLEIQKSEIETQKKLVEEKNTEISDSINYAHHIQTSALPEQKEINAYFPNHILFYKPKDIVSGDFYWSAQSGDIVLLAVVDCTGHGVPGAITSMIGSMLLNEIHYVKHLLQPNIVLTELNRLVKITLKQEENSLSKDGMDIAFCAWNKKTNQLLYAGANRPLYFLRKDEGVKEIKATKQSIGGFTSLMQSYDLHEIQLQEGDTVVLSSDGYADQFGGQREKKFTTKQFKVMLGEMANMDVGAQQILLQNRFYEWKGKYAQTDDVLVFGFKV